MALVQTFKATQPLWQGDRCGEGIYVVGGFNVARGFIPVRVRSSRKTCGCGMTERTQGALRTPTGINPLATLNPPHHINLLTTEVLPPLL